MILSIVPSGVYSDWRREFEGLVRRLLLGSLGLCHSSNIPDKPYRRALPDLLMDRKVWCLCRACLL